MQSPLPISYTSTEKHKKGEIDKFLKKKKNMSHASKQISKEK